MDEQGRGETVSKKASIVEKTYGKEILLLIITCLVMVILVEVFLRSYYWWTDGIIAADNNELCLKEMKRAKTYVSSSQDNFVYKREWGEDPMIGLVPAKNYTSGDETVFLRLKGGTITKSMVIAQSDHHNNQGLTNVEEFLMKKPENVSVRIALFGDSFTCGSEGPLLFNMGYILKELIPESDVLNFCVVGHGIDTMYARYVQEGKQYAPDVVVFNILVDDLKRAFECPLFRPNLQVINGRLRISSREWPTLRDFYFNYSLPEYESYVIKQVLWTYNSYTKAQRDLRKGFELFNVMLDELKTQTRSDKATLIVVPIIQELPSKIEKEIYRDMMMILKEKGVLFFDSEKYFSSQKRVYRNQSFYYIAEKDGFGHFSPVGNALFAQKLKNVLEKEQVVMPTPNYRFANFKKFEFMYLIPEDINQELEGRLRVLSTFKINESDGAYSFALKKSGNVE